MKTIKIILIAVAFGWATTACDRSDDGGMVELPDMGDLSGTSDLDRKIQSMYNKYGVVFRTEFTDNEMSYDWVSVTNKLKADRVTDQVAAKKVIDYIDQRVFSIFPQALIRDYMPPVILLADELTVDYTDETVGATPPTVTRQRIVAGHVSSMALIVGNVNSSFDVNSNDVLAEMISLIVERMYFKMPAATAFLTITGTPSTAATGTHWSGYLGTGSGLPTYTVANMGFGTTNSAAWWWPKIILRPSRLGYTLDTFTPSSSKHSYQMLKPTFGQDLGDYVAFILTKTASEKDTYYDDVTAKTADNTTKNYVTKMKSKVTEAKKYFKDNFNITLTDKPNP